MQRNAIQFIEQLSMKPENQSVESSWYCIAACSFASSNQGSLVTHVYRAAIAPHEADPNARRLVHRRMKESLLDGGFLFGSPRSMIALVALNQAIPDEESKDRECVRNNTQNPYEMRHRGQEYMRKTYGDDTDAVLEKLQNASPDL